MTSRRRCPTHVRQRDREPFVRWTMARLCKDGCWHRVLLVTSFRTSCSHSSSTRCWHLLFRHDAHPEVIDGQENLETALSISSCTVVFLRCSRALAGLFQCSPRNCVVHLEMSGPSRSAEEVALPGLWFTRVRLRTRREWIGDSGKVFTRTYLLY